MVMKEFDVYKARGGNKAKLARRLDKRPEQITRWLSEPGNLTFDTLSDLLLGLSGAELAMLLEYPADQPTRAPRLPERLLREKSISKTTTFSVSNIFSKTIPGPTAAIGTATLIPSKSVYVEIEK
jgi:hypothetical protein